VTHHECQQLFQEDFQMRKRIILATVALGVLSTWACSAARGERIVAWGSSEFGQCDAPTGSDFAAVAAGESFSLALKSDDSLAAWGDNEYGQTNVPPGYNFVAISARYKHGLALKTDGSLAAWGNNEWFQCNVPGGYNFVDIAAGMFHSVALKTDGSLAAWGDNGHGQRNVPAGNNFVDISAGGSHNIALKSDGSVVAWGHNGYDECNVPEGNDFLAISAGWWHSLALKSDGSLVAWGLNSKRQCNVPSGNDFIGIIGGRFHSLALKADGSLIGWGGNNQGQTKVPAGNDLVAVSAGEFHNLALVIGGPRTIYVDTDANGANDGSSWQDAFNHLQDALAAARSHDEIRVAQGVYKPDEDTDHPDGTGNSFIAFELKNSVPIYGGYAGFGRPDPNERDVNAYETVLSGNLRVDDHSLHVVTASFTDATAILDGFTITGGGYGLSPNIRERSGAGMFNLRASPTVRNCTFTGNSVSNGYGGAVYNDLGSPTFSRCVFNDNSADLDGAGGGMYNDHARATVINCTFIDNSAESGGGMYNYICSPLVSGCIFTGNQATGVIHGTGGGGLNNNMSSTTVINCIFSYNTARGGELGSGGGAVRNNGGGDSKLSLINCLITNNTSGHLGGGLYNNTDPLIINCTFTANSAAENGGGILNYIGTSKPQLTNCILWGNADRGGMDESAQIHFGSPFIDYSCIQGWTGDLGGTGNADTDPCFVDPNSGDYRLVTGSPAIDTGDNNSVPADSTDLDGDGNTTELIPWDLDGNPRLVDGDRDRVAVVDMGAYEAFIPPIEVWMKFTPQSLNPDSNGNWVKAHFVLLEGFVVEDVDANRPVEIKQLGIESHYMNVFVNEDGLVEVEAGFNRNEFCSVVRDGELIEITVVGFLTDNRRFAGTDTVRILDKTMERLATMSSYWLVSGCSAPDWCGGSDINRDSIVNFLDYAMSDGCCIEVGL
jgi:hypothetical protein